MDKISRKEFLTRTGVIGISLLGAASLTQFCKKEEKPQQQTQNAPNCSDVTGLKQEDIEQRNNLKYVDVSSDPAKNCSNCALFISPEGTNPCGGCNLIKGPISPQGWCTSWVQKG